MIIVSHRINTSEALLKIPTKSGVEIDIRSRDDQLILHHDPFCDGELLSDWLKNYKHKLLILNVKEEGLEPQILSLMEKYCIDHFFFLDQSFPFIIKSLNAGEKRTAVRVSEYESIETALKVAGNAQWVWVDCFTKFPINQNEALRLKENFKICIVSPELQGRSDINEIIQLKNLLREINLKPDAVCTKRSDIWEQG
jgi:hypothetical protein